MDVEDIVQVDTMFGKGLVGFVLKKFLEGKFGIKLGNDFTVPKLKIHSYGAGEKISFHIEVVGTVSKVDILKLIQGEKHD